MRGRWSSMLLGALMLASWPSRGEAAAEVRHERHRSGDWRLEISRDTFSGRVVCRLGERRERMFYEGGAIGFRVGPMRDVAGSVYRVDGGRPRVWRDDLPELLALGTPIDAGGTIDPAGGVVRVPWRRLSAARRIAVQSRSGDRPRIFALGGARDLLQRARERGCAPDARFVR